MFILKVDALLAEYYEATEVFDVLQIHVRSTHSKAVTKLKHVRYGLLAKEYQFARVLALLLFDL